VIETNPRAGEEREDGAMHDDETYIQRLRINRQEYEELLARLHSNAGDPPGSEDRARTRHQYAVSDIRLTVQHPEGGASRFIVHGRNISRSGVGVLHGGFVHPGSACEIQLNPGKGDPIRVSGEVRHCRLVTGSCHEVGILFHEEIDTSLLLAEDEEEEESESGGANYLHVDGSILAAEPFAPDLELLSHHLSILGLEINTATTPGATLDSVKRSAPNLILFGLRLGEEAIATISAIRGMDFTGPILVLSAESNPKMLHEVRNAGATDIIPKPYNMDLLLAQLQAYLGEGGTDTPIFSTASDQPGMKPLIEQYVKVVHRTADQIEKALAEQEWGALRALCCQLKGSGCGYGFQLLTVAAIAALGEIDVDPESERSRKMTETLIARCRTLTVRTTSERSAAA
jgi:DNA-binding response OmpR family regulator